MPWTYKSKIDFAKLKLKLGWAAIFLANPPPPGGGGDPPSLKKMKKCQNKLELSYAKLA